MGEFLFSFNSIMLRDGNSEVSYILGYILGDFFEKVEFVELFVGNNNLINEESRVNV